MKVVPLNVVFRIWFETSKDGLTLCINVGDHEMVLSIKDLIEDHYDNFVCEGLDADILKKELKKLRKGLLEV